MRFWQVQGYPTIMETQVAHRSFSSFQSWVRCGKAWQLERVLKAPSQPAWFLVGGKAFHAAVEKYLIYTVDGSVLSTIDKGQTNE